jgi:hypothetical protein
VTTYISSTLKPLPKATERRNNDGPPKAKAVPPNRDVHRRDLQRPLNAAPVVTALGGEIVV